MALALRLGQWHTTPQQLRVEATLTLDDVNGIPTIISSHLVIRAEIGGMVGDKFQRAVDEVAALCPFSGLFAGARVSVDAELDPS